MGEVNLVSPGPGGNKTPVGFAGRGGTGGDLLFHGAPRCWDGFKTWIRRRSTTPSELQAGKESFLGLAHPHFATPKTSPILFGMNAGNRVNS